MTAYTCNHCGRELLKCTCRRASLAGLAAKIVQRDAEIKKLREENASQHRAIKLGLDIEAASDKRNSNMRAEIERLAKENESLAAWQCLHTDGKTGLYGDDHGTQHCAMEERVKELEEILTLADGFKEAAPHKSREELVARLLAVESFYAGVQEGADQLRKERDHWKANHDAMVLKNRLLRERPDLPAERIASYKLLMDALEAVTGERDNYERALDHYAPSDWRETWPNVDMNRRLKEAGVRQPKAGEDDDV